MNPHRISRTLDHLMIFFDFSLKTKISKVSCLIPKDGNQHFKKNNASNIILQICWVPVHSTTFTYWCFIGNAHPMMARCKNSHQQKNNTNSSTQNHLSVPYSHKISEICLAPAVCHGRFGDWRLGVAMNFGTYSMVGFQGNPEYDFALVKHKAPPRKSRCPRKRDHFKRNVHLPTTDVQAILC